MKNYSRQREAILQVLRSTDTHPTAAEVYERVRELIPNISLGTVYRNLSELSRNGDILSLNVGDGHEHFDYDTTPHAHLHCKACGCITDAKLETDPLAKLSKKMGFTPETTIYVAYGICQNCKTTN